MNRFAETFLPQSSCVRKLHQPQVCPHAFSLPTPVKPALNYCGVRRNPLSHFLLESLANLQTLTCYFCLALPKLERGHDFEYRGRPEGCALGLEIPAGGMKFTPLFSHQTVAHTSNFSQRCFVGARQDSLFR